MPREIRAAGLAQSSRLSFEDRFGIDRATMRKLMDVALSKGGEFADLFFEYRVAYGLSFEDGIVRDATRGTTVGVGIRVVSGDQTGYAYSDDLAYERLRKAAETAAAIAREEAKVKAVDVNPVEARDLYAAHRSSLTAPIAEKVRIVERADKAARAHDSRIIKVQIGFSDEVRFIQIATSDGLITSDAQPMAALRISTIAQEKDRRETGYFSGGGRVGLEFFERPDAPEYIARTAARQAIVQLGAVEAPAGEMPVVLGPAYSGILLHEAIGHGLEADFNRQKTSNFSDRIGERVASDQCTIVDDGTIEHSRGSIDVDDEANLPKMNVLIDKGILRSYMHDRISARHFKTAPSGNGRRQSYEHYPLPRMTNTYMLAGPHDPEEIIKSVKDGIYAVAFSGGQVNISNGDYVFSVTEAYRIENGKVTTPLKGVTLIGNGPDSLSKVTMVGSDMKLSDSLWTCGKSGQSVPVSVGIPTVLVSQITVGGTQVKG
ncbi:MAG: metallopeptidase TldD-related protein [Acidobacteriota bacterium]